MKFYFIYGLMMVSKAVFAFTVAPENLPTTLVFPPYLHSYGIRKASQAKLKLFLGLRASFDNPQGLATVKMKSRDNLSTQDDDDEVTVYGVNSGRHQIIYNTSMYAIAAFGQKGTGKDQFLHPKGIAADVDGNVYIADTKNHRIVHLFNPQKEVQWIQTFGSKGSKTGQFLEPEGVALDSRGNMYVADTKNNRIQVLDSDGQFKAILSGSGDDALQNPTQLAVCDRHAPWCRHREDAVFVIDQNRHRIQKLGFNGQHLASVKDWPNTSIRYEYLCLDYYSQVYVTDFNSSRIIKFDRNLTPLTTFGTKGTDDRQFVEPRGITIWRRYGQVFVAEKEGAQYYWLGTDCADLSLKKTENRMGIGYTTTLFVTEPSFLTVFSLFGTDTCVIRKKGRIDAGENRILLGMPKDKTIQNPLFIRLEPTYSSYTYFAKDYKRNIP